MINSTGNIVADDAVGEHGFNLVQPEGQADKPDLLRTAQPLAGWGQIGGEVCLCYWDALRWALHAATGSKHLATRTIWNRACVRHLHHAGAEGMLYHAAAHHAEAVGGPVAAGAAHGVPCAAGGRAGGAGGAAVGPGRLPGAGHHPKDQRRR